VDAKNKPLFFPLGSAGTRGTPLRVVSRPVPLVGRGTQRDNVPQCPVVPLEIIGEFAITADNQHRDKVEK